MANDVQAQHPDEELAWVQAVSRVPEPYRRDIFESLLAAINEYERTQDAEFLTRVMNNLRTSLQLLSSPDFVKRYEESIESPPEPSALGVSGWVERISASVGA